MKSQRSFIDTLGLLADEHVEVRIRFAGERRIEDRATEAKDKETKTRIENVGTGLVGTIAYVGSDFLWLDALEGADLPHIIPFSCITSVRLHNKKEAVLEKLRSE